MSNFRVLKAVIATRHMDRAIARLNGLREDFPNIADWDLLLYALAIEYQNEGMKVDEQCDARFIPGTLTLTRETASDRCVLLKGHSGIHVRGGK